MIPEWNVYGFLPPKDENNPVSRFRSPYKTTMLEMMNKLVAPKERMEIMQGFLKYRKELYKAGIINGFQWIDGSFAEDIETLMGRTPNDIDIVTFYYLPDGITQKALFDKEPSLFNHDYVKNMFRVDNYPVQLGDVCDDTIVDQIVYWYSLWSHTRNNAWKGFLKIDLSESDDSKAEFFLKTEKVNA
jgi:hypothetical protein